MWQAISTLAAKGIEKLYFGRTAAANVGLRRFKLAWGATEQVIKYFRCCCDGSSSGARPDEGGAFYNNVFRWLPTAVSRGIGGMLYPHLD